MSSTSPTAPSVDLNTLITLKVLYNDHTRRFKIPLKELGARVLPQKLRHLLGIPADVNVILERYSDSAASYVRLDSEDTAIYRQLHRAAKAKLKLRIKVTRLDVPSAPAQTENLPEYCPSPRCNYLETVLTSPLPGDQPMTDLPGSSQWCDPVRPTPCREFLPDSITNPVVSHTSPNGIFCIDCNQCGRSIPNEHYHCSICDNGDYDLCLSCVQTGFTCLNDEHWLIKRVVTDGVVTNSITEKVPPRKVRAPEPEKEQNASIPEAPLPAPMAPPTSPAPPHGIREAPELAAPSAERICNGCLREFDETKMVTCDNCADYDLCTGCILNNTHGHHPAHTFSVISEDNFCLKSLVLSRCKAGRNAQHSAICDGCEKRIAGVRHKCLSCPDWDYCADCHENAAQIHPGHRFVPLYGPIAEPVQHHEVHYGIYCDGPLCKDKPFPGYITGVRYKCSVCFDTDFCAKCEALPTNSHNRTHPMVMLKTPVRNVSVSTVQEHPMGNHVRSLGDQPMPRASVQVTTPAEPKPSPRVNLPKPVVEPPVSESTEHSTPSSADAATDPMVNIEKPTEPSDATYRAFFERDIIPDGTTMRPNEVFQQTWTLYNPGPLAWPVGSGVRFVGGDSMFNVDMDRPLSLASVSDALESNKLVEPLQPGQRADFTVSLKAPSHVGTAISYWRLKLAEGTPFGHRLWCDIRVQDAPPVEPTVEATEPAGSQMVFPKLEKESPSASTHESAAPAPSVTHSSEQDVLEDVESLTIADDETEAGFLTDEEYDILDASDQEFIDARLFPRVSDFLSASHLPSLLPLPRPPPTADTTMGAWLTLALLAVLVATLYGPVSRGLTVLGVWRPSNLTVAQQVPFQKVADTIHCEDLHYHEPSGLIFTACEDSVETRFKWFPPLGNVDGPATTTGSIHVIQPETMKSTRLAFENFAGPFVTHGIDLVADPARSDALYIFAVNHLSNPAYFSTSTPAPDESPAASQIELFHHVLGSSTVRHVRSIAHPLVVTPNDLYAASPTSLYVTNDHRHRAGFKRTIEDLIPAARWSNVVHLQLADGSGGDIHASTALTGLQNNNGLGHGQSPDEILICSAIGGTMYRARPHASANASSPALEVVDAFPYDSTIDNPSYYVDPFRDAADDASGYVQAGLRRAIDMPATHADPHGRDGAMVWYTRRAPGSREWVTRALLEDDGAMIRSASSAVLVPTSGRKARLFVSGFVSESVIALEVDLS
ncbi:hypothetical protein BDV59DRAFT_192656 [Aspergillus ambiguus]|uniref:ZZ type zinc finger domain protein n=1 Tax=Aspergillus ambiguus TaxID=176160 RepID=UPI003CCE3657